MIFVTVGSQKNQFNRLLKSLDRLVASGEITDEIFAQTGYSDYEPEYYAFQRFLDHEEFERIETQAELVIAHGGTGAVMGALKKGKKVIAVPRKYELGEHNDDHQIQMVSQLAESGLILCCEDTDTLGEMIREIKSGSCRTFRSVYHSNTSGYLRDIEAFIEETKK